MTPIEWEILIGVIIIAVVALQRWWHWRREWRWADADATAAEQESARLRASLKQQHALLFPKSPRYVRDPLSSAEQAGQAEWWDCPDRHPDQRIVSFRQLPFESDAEFERRIEQHEQSWHGIEPAKEETDERQNSA